MGKSFGQLTNYVQNIETKTLKLTKKMKSVLVPMVLLEISMIMIGLSIKFPKLSQISANYFRQLTNLKHH